MLFQIMPLTEKVIFKNTTLNTTLKLSMGKYFDGKCLRLPSTARVNYFISSPSILAFNAPNTIVIIFEPESKKKASNVGMLALFPP